MQRSFIHLATAALTVTSLAACTDHRELLAPARPNVAIISGGGGGIVQIPRATDLMEISAGGYHTCVRQRGGLILCWGLNTTFQIGVPSTAYCAGTTVYLAGTVPCVTVATAVPLLTLAGTGPAVGAAHVTLGTTHTCALDTLKTAWCWGDNSSGQIGRGGGLYTQYPLPVTGSNGLTFVSLGAGGNATCGSSSIGGGLMCWGQFPSSVGTKSTPTWVAAGTFSTVIVTTDHGCVNGFTSGQWDCWGSNASGQLGTSPSTLASSAPFFTVHAMDNAPAIAVANGITCNDEPNGGSSQCFRCEPHRFDDRAAGQSSGHGDVRLRAAGRRAISRRFDRCQPRLRARCSQRRLVLGHRGQGPARWRQFSELHGARDGTRWIDIPVALRGHRFLLRHCHR